MVLPPGDDGTNKEATSTGKLNQENEHIYNLWCSGRVCCEGMLIQLRVSREFLIQCVSSFHFFKVTLSPQSLVSHFFRFDLKCVLKIIFLEFPGGLAG